MRFGPGGIWGSDLYVSGETIDPDGVATAFAQPFTEFAWVDGPGLDGDMFTYIPGDPAGTLSRVKADGTRTIFATNAGGRITGCDGALWIANQYGCWVVEQKRTGRPQ